jgi:hypothetical protein
LADRWTGRTLAAAVLFSGLTAIGVGAGAEDDVGKEARSGQLSMAQLPEQLLDEAGRTNTNCPVAREQIKHLWRMVRLEQVAEREIDPQNVEALTAELEQEINADIGHE